MGVRFTFIERQLDRIATWFGAYGVLSTAMSWLAKHFVVFGPIGWPEAIYLGLGAAAIIVLVISGALIAWRIFRPLDSSREGLMTQTHPAATEIDQITAAAISEAERRIIARLEKIETESHVIREREESNHLEMIASINVDRDNTSAKFDYHTKQIVILSEELAGLRAGMGGKFQALDYSISAIGHREFMIKCASEIEIELASLKIESCDDDLTDYAKWSAWEMRHSHWEDLLDKWLIYGSLYYKDLRSQVFRKEEWLYDNGRWAIADSQLRDSNAVRKYKTCHITHMRWEGVKDKVHTAARGVAFEGKRPAHAVADG